MSEQDHLNLKPCPFCNVLGSPALGRVVCWECGNAGPSDDPAGAKWNALAADVARGKVAAKLAEASKPFARFLAMTDAKPLRGTGDEIYGVHTGTEWEASITYSHLRELTAALAEYDALEQKP